MGDRTAPDFAKALNTLGAVASASRFSDIADQATDKAELRQSVEQAVATCSRMLQQTQSTDAPDFQKARAGMREMEVAIARDDWEALPQLASAVLQNLGMLPSN